MSHAIDAENLTKHYRRMAAGFRLRTLKSALLEGTLTRGLRPEETIVALDSVSFQVGRGEAFGVIGANGSGKSTLLKLVAGLFKPTSGRLAVAGRVAALIELGAGFHPEITGRENVYINGAMLGLTRRQIDQRYDRIVEFSGLGDFLEEPVKNYSSGMYVRLGFAVAVHTDPDVLLIDEVLSVGDEEFGHRCLRRIQEHLVAGGTLLVVSHSLDLVESLCDRVLWLDHGRARGIGEPRRMIDAYRQQVAAAEGERHLAEKGAREAAEAEAAGGQAAESGVDAEGAGDEDEVLRWGSRQVEIVGFRLLVGGAERYELESGAAATFEIDVVAREALEDFVFGVAISTPRGIECWGTNTDLGGLTSERLEGQARASLACPALRLAAGEYEVDLAVHSRNGSPYDYRRQCFRFTVTSRERGVGVYAPEHRWTFAGGARLEAPASRGEMTRAIKESQ